MPQKDTTTVFKTEAPNLSSITNSLKKTKDQEIDINKKIVTLKKNGGGEDISKTSGTSKQ